MESARGQFDETAVEPVLCLPTDFKDVVGETFLSAGKLLADFRRLGVVLRTFNE